MQFLKTMVCIKSVLGCLKKNVLSFSTLVALIFGVCLGIATRSLAKEWTMEELKLVGIAGDLYIRMLRSVVIPLLFPKLILAVAGMDSKLSGRMGGLLILIYTSQNIINQLMSLGFALWIQPGAAYTILAQNGTDIQDETEVPNVSIILTIMDLFKNMFPKNIVRALISQSKTLMVHSSDPGKEITLQETYVDSTNNLGLVVFCIFFGFALRSTMETAKPFIHALESISIAASQMTNWMINFAPIGVFSLVWSQIILLDNFGETFTQLGKYFLTILIVLFIHCWILTPLCLLAITKRNPIKHFYNMFEVIPTAIATSSGIACYPITSRCLEEKNGIDPKVVRFALPIVVTINVLPITSISILFLTQLDGIVPTFSSIVIMIITLTFVATGAAGIPQDNLILIFLAVSILGVSTDNIVKVISVEWIIDRFGTTSKIMMDSAIIGIIHHFMKEQVEKTYNNDENAP